MVSTSTDSTLSFVVVMVDTDGFLPGLFLTDSPDSSELTLPFQSTGNTNEFSFGLALVRSCSQRRNGLSCTVLVPCSARLAMAATGCAGAGHR